MAGRRRNDRAGFIAVFLCILLLLFPAAVFAWDDAPFVFVRYSQDNAVGTMWTLTLLVPYDDPNRVNILTPPFPASVSLEQIVKNPRIINVREWEAENEGGPLFERWTAAEFTFILTEPGVAAFAPFVVTTPRGQAETNFFEINIIDPRHIGRPRFVFAWEGSVEELVLGESAFLSLSLSDSGHDREIALSESWQLAPEVPPGHIMEFVPLSPRERQAGMVFKMRLIPLSVIPFTLEKRQFSSGDADFEIPALQIPVRRPDESVITARAPARGDMSANAAEAASRRPPFPPLETAAAVHASLYRRHREECDIIYNTAASLWERGYVGNALALLRKNEREHRAGALFAVLRREAEQALGFTATGNERRIFLPFGRNRTRSAVLRETTVRRIPDSAGTEIARFREGQPVLVFAENDRARAESPGRQESWLRVTANDNSGISGWVLKEKIIFY